MSNTASTKTTPKEFGVIGLGRMGGDLALQAIEKGWRVVGYNCSPEQTRALSEKGLVAAVQALTGRRALVMNQTGPKCVCISSAFGN